MELINYKPVLVQIMAWRWTGNKPLSEPMMAEFTDAYLYHSWVNMLRLRQNVIHLADNILRFMSLNEYLIDVCS